MKGCSSMQTLRVYRFVMLRMWRCCMSGLVCVRGGRFIMILMSFFCVLMNGCICFGGVLCDPYCDASGEVCVDLRVVELFHCVY